MQFNLTKGIDRFFNACDNLVSAKFILADTKISELVGAIADCPTLYNLFDMLTADFDYPQAKETYLTASEDSELRGRFSLPDSVGDKLVFIFCLLIELDSKKLNLNKFLNCYFYEDGSYFESWYSFCNRIIKPFKSLVKAALEELYPQEFAGYDTTGAAKADKYSGSTYYKEAEGIIFNCRELIITDESLSETQKKDALELLDGLGESLLQSDTKQLSYILTGLKYIESKNGGLNDELLRLENLIEESVL